MARASRGSIASPQDVWVWACTAYSDDPRSFESYALSRSSRAGLRIDHPRTAFAMSLVTQAILDLRSQAERNKAHPERYRPLLIPLRPGLLMRQVAWTVQTAARESRRHIPFDDLRLLETSVHECAREDPTLDGMGITLDEARSAFCSDVAAAISSGDLPLSQSNIEALRASAQRIRRVGPPLNAAMRQAARRGRAILWPWVEDWLLRNFGIVMRDAAERDRAKRLTHVLLALGAFDAADSHLVADISTSEALSGCGRRGKGLTSADGTSSRIRNASFLSNNFDQATSTSSPLVARERM